LGEEKLGFIGVGNMGEALLRGIIGSGKMSSLNILANDIDTEKLERLCGELGIKRTKDNCELVGNSDIILLAVKPNVIKSILVEISQAFIKPKWCISIAAGVSTDFIEGCLLPGSPVVRVMPNTPAMVYEGMTAICPGRSAGDEHLQKVKHIFQSVGKVVILQEKLMDAVTALSGSGPAFVFLMIESLIDAGVQLGLSRSDAVIMASQTFLGASKMALESGEHPAVLKNRVTSPAGTTAAGLYELEKNRVRAAIIDAVVAAATRSKQMTSS